MFDFSKFNILRNEKIAESENAEPELSKEDRLTLKLLEEFEKNERFHVFTVDGTQWIDPHSLAPVDTPFDIERSAVEWLVNNKPWRKHPIHSIKDIRAKRWEMHIKSIINEDRRFKLFDKKGFWFNPFTQKIDKTVRLEGRKLTLELIIKMARALVRLNEKQLAEPIPSARLLDKTLKDHNQDEYDHHVQQAPAAAKSPRHQALEAAARKDDAPIAVEKKKPATLPGETRRFDKSADDAPTDTTQLGIYTVQRRIGKGGMGDVYLARHETMDRTVALKVLPNRLAENKQFVGRFLREARAAGKVFHPNVICCYDAGEDKGRIFIAMEYVNGGDASQLMSKMGGRLSAERALSIVTDATRGLVAVHQARLLHRDIKPANIFLTSEGTAKLADLGLAKSQDMDDQMTMSGATIGTPAYMSPEQIKAAEDIDIRSDIYAMGATFHAMLAGKPPFEGDTMWAIFNQVMTAEVPQLQDLGIEGCDDFQKIINTCLEKSANDRYSDPSELLTALEAIKV